MAGANQPPAGLRLGLFAEAPGQETLEDGLVVRRQRRDLFGDRFRFE
jgi:hypothetical protein